MNIYLLIPSILISAAAAADQAPWPYETLQSAPSLEITETQVGNTTFRYGRVNGESANSTTYDAGSVKFTNGRVGEKSFRCTETFFGESSSITCR